ncbi:MAG: ankyrin repeat domain-containing protein [candidate division Zixibacteria bacterium]
MNIKRAFILCFLVSSSLAVQTQDIFKAAEKGDMSTIKMLLKKDPKLVTARDMKRTPGNTPLHFAASEGHTEVIEYMIEKGADVDTKSYFGITPLHVAAQNGQQKVIELLIKKGADIHAKGRSRHTPAFYAAFGGHLEIIELLLRNGIDINSKGMNGMTLLHSAASGGHLALTQYLVEKGMDVNTSNAFGRTPLHFAVSGGYKAVIELLLDKGSDINKKSLDMRTPLHLATLGNHQEVADLLIEKEADNRPWGFPVLEGEYLGQKPPGKIPEIFTPGIISTDGGDFAGTFSPDGEEFYYTANGGIKNLRMNTIMVTRRINNRWTEPEVAWFSGKTFDFEPHISPDGEKLYFGTRRPLEENGESTGMHQWVLNKSEMGWAEPKPLRTPFVENHVMYVSTANDGTIYFTGRDGIYLSRLDDGKYKKLQKLSNKINDDYNAAHPFIAPDESYLIFDAMPYGPQEGARLFISFREEDTTWTTPKNLSKVWGSRDPEMAASVSPDGKYIFFSREGNIYWVDAKVIDDLR